MKSIKIILLVGITVGALIAGASWVVTLYQSQQIALTQAQSEIKKLQEAKQAQTETIKPQEQSSSTPKVTKKLNLEDFRIKNPSIEITSVDLSRYITGVVQIDCGTSFGSGSLWNIPGIGYGVLTNKHVVEDPKLRDNNDNQSCMVRVRDKEGLADEGTYTLDFTTEYKWNDSSDLSFLKIEVNTYMENKLSFNSTPIEKLNYSISSLKKCPERMVVNSPVILIGYPAYALKQSGEADSSYSLSSRISTNGIISGYDNSVMLPPHNLLNQNYYVSAKIDSGNSGGIAFSKDSTGLCVLGIPTWLTVGNYETQGLIQNIHNALYQKY